MQDRKYDGNDDNKFYYVCFKLQNNSSNSGSKTSAAKQFTANTLLINEIKIKCNTILHIQNILDLSYQ